jgi:hypothetical protein
MVEGVRNGFRNVLDDCISGDEDAVAVEKAMRGPAAELGGFVKH